MTFTFTMDAFPGYTLFDKTHQVLAVLQVVNPDEEDLVIGTTVMEHYDDEDFSTDSSSDGGDGGDTGDTGDGGNTGDTGDTGGNDEP